MSLPRTRIRAPTTNFSTLHHFLVIAEFLAHLSALLTDLRASSAYKGVKLGTAQHEISTGLTDFGAVAKQLYMLRLGMLIALLKTISEDLRANAVALCAAIQALFDFFGHWNYVHVAPP